MTWRDADTLWVGTDFGPGSLTTSGYPRIVKLWKRGTPLASAITVYEGKDTDVASYGMSIHSPSGRRHDLVIRIPAFFRQEIFVHRDGKLVRLRRSPTDADFNGVWKDQVAVLAAHRLDGGRAHLPLRHAARRRRRRLLEGKPDPQVLFEPTRARVAGRGGLDARPRARADPRQRAQQARLA